MVWGVGCSKCLPGEPGDLSRPYSLGEHEHGLGFISLGQICAALTKLGWALGTGQSQECKVWVAPNTLKDWSPRKFFPEVFKYPGDSFWSSWWHFPVHALQGAVFYVPLQFCHLYLVQPFRSLTGAFPVLSGCQKWG